MWRVEEQQAGATDTQVLMKDEQWFDTGRNGYAVRQVRLNVKYPEMKKENVTLPEKEIVKVVLRSLNYSSRCNKVTHLGRRNVFGSSFNSRQPTLEGR